MNDTTPIREGKYLTFALGSEEYGIGIIKVREIIGIMPVTPIPKTPKYVKGVINLRGKIIPVVDLRLKFGLDERKHTQYTCIIVVEIDYKDSVLSTGIVVDQVNEVANISADDIEDTPTFGVDIDTSYILGMAKSKKNVRILLEISKVLGAGDLEIISRAA